MPEKVLSQVRQCVHSAIQELLGYLLKMVVMTY